MDLKKAEEIVELFGGCTVVYECYGPDELLEEWEVWVENAEDKSLEGFTQYLYEGEKHHFEGYWNTDPDITKEERVERRLEEKNFLFDLRTRLASAGFKVK